MSVTPASAQATAWAKEKSSVMLHRMPPLLQLSLRGQTAHGSALEGRAGRPPPS